MSGTARFRTVDIQELRAITDAECMYNSFYIKILLCLFILALPSLVKLSPVIPALGPNVDWGASVQEKNPGKPRLYVLVLYSLRIIFLLDLCMTCEKHSWIVVFFVAIHFHHMEAEHRR